MCCPKKTCQAGFDCVDQMCVPDPAELSCNGSTQYVVQRRYADSKCAAPPAWVKADSEAEALQCAQAIGLETLLVSTNPADAEADAYLYCPKAGLPGFGGELTIYAYSEADAQACMVFGNCAALPDECGYAACN